MRIVGHVRVRILVVTTTASAAVVASTGTAATGTAPVAVSSAVGSSSAGPLSRRRAPTRALQSDGGGEICHLLCELVVAMLQCLVSRVIRRVERGEEGRLSDAQVVVDRR